MLSPKIVNGIASFVVNRTRKLSPRQIATLKHTKDRYGDKTADMYLHSLLGLKPGRTEVKRIKTPNYVSDSLASKSKGTILERFKGLLDCSDDANHKPSNRNVGQWLGVEIEFIYPASPEYECSNDCDNGECECSPTYYPSEDEAQNTLRKAIQRANIPRASVKTDGSVSDDEGVGLEVTLLFNSADGFEPLNRLCKVLREHGCYVNKTCGLHVHLDARHLKPKGVKLIGRRLGRALPILKWIVDPSRHTNQYCAMSVSRFCSTHASRYHAVNLTAFFKYKTIEVRMHGGSTNASKIRNWIELIQFLSNSKVPKTFTTFQQLIDLGLPTHLVEYADKRITRLNPTAWTSLIPVPVPAIDAHDASPAMAVGSNE